MSKTKLEEIVSQLTKEQQQSLAEIVTRRRDQQLEPSDIAIIGLSGRYPQADNHYDFWNKIQQGTNFIQEVPVSRWDHSDYYDPQVNKSFVPHKTRCKFGAFLNAYDQFDASFFDLHPGEVSRMDPQERLALETSWSCIEDAGYVPSKLDKEVGIFSGLTYGEYQKIIPITTHFCMLNNRVAYFFNFQGPTITTDAGCSSSLTAIHLACQSLIRKECQTAIVIGANVILHPDHYTSLSSSLSPTVQPVSNPFGTDDGWIPAEGVVSILLKPLPQALQSQDHIYAVIKSSHISQEGKTSWFTAFNPKQQAVLIHDNFKKSGIHPETISYVEAAANGSSLGDAIELEGLTTAFNRFTDKKQFCPIGSVKSNVGHGEAVSTLLQLTKLLLQFKSKTIIPLINLKEKNPNLRIENSPFYFRTSTQKWEPPTLKLNGKQFKIPRRATISSFGGGGNIGHLILEEHVPENIKTQTPGSYFIPISSKTADQLRETIENYIRFFKEYQTFDSEWEANYTLLNIMFTLCVGRVPFQERVVFIVKNLETLIEQFHQFFSRESAPNIITKTNAGTFNTTTESSREPVQNCMENQSWHELAQRWVGGVDISRETWERFFDSYDVQRIPLPTYCFQRQSFPIPKPLHSGLSKYNGNSITKTAGKIEKPIDNTSYKDKPETPPPIEIINEPSQQNNEIDTKLIKIFKDVFAKAINRPASQIDLSTPLDKYDFNSMMVISIANELETYFSTVPKTLFFECQTIRDVMNYFIKGYPDEIREIVQKKEDITSSEQVIKKPFQHNMVRSNGDRFHHQSKKTGHDDTLEDLAKAILSDSISAEMVLKKL